MATRISVTHVCDKCGSDIDSDEPYFTYTISSRKGPARKGLERDLCEMCNIEFEVTYALTSPVNSGVVEKCRVPGCAWVGNSAQGARLHEFRKHPDWHKENKASSGVPCTEKDCDFIGVSERGLSRHIKSSHEKSKVTA